MDVRLLGDVRWNFGYVDNPYGCDGIDTMNINAHKWATLPLTLRLGEFCRWTGYTRQHVREMARMGQIRVIRLPGMKLDRYLKSDVSKLTGNQFNTNP
jgi:hypothetical protein